MQTITSLTSDFDDITNNDFITARTATAGVKNDPNAVHVLRISHVVPSLLLVVGTIGNILSLAVFSRRHLRSSHTSFMFIVLALADTTVLWCAHIPSVIPYWFGVPKFVGRGNHTSCGVYLFIGKVAASFAIWVLTVIAMERLIFVYFPHRAKVILTRSKILVVFFTILVILCGFYGIIIRSTTSEPIYSNGKRVAGICQQNGNPELAHFTVRFLPVMEFVVGQAISFCIMLCCNVAIVIKLIISARRRQQTTGHDNQRSTTNTTVMLLFTTTLFLILTLPHALRFLTGMKPTTPSAYLFSQVGQVLRSCHFSTNFFVYFLTGTRFREELVAMFSCRPKVAENQTSLSSLDSALTPNGESRTPKIESCVI